MVLFSISRRKSGEFFEQGHGGLFPIPHLLAIHHFLLRHSVLVTSAIEAAGLNETNVSHLLEQAFITEHGGVLLRFGFILGRYRVRMSAGSAASFLSRTFFSLPLSTCTMENITTVFFHVVFISLNELRC